jgi:asparagine synthase (glutamine-hydrolysing)
MDLVEIMMKQDQMSMAASIESRVPFLDHLLVEFAGTIPPHLRLQGRAGKQLVKKAAEIPTLQHRASTKKWDFQFLSAVGSKKIQRERSEISF